MVAARLVQFRKVHLPGKIVEVEHRIVLTMLAEKCNVLTQVHILEMISDKAAIAPLYALTKSFECVDGFHAKTNSRQNYLR